ncbi:unnamed protein product [Effrenium voratum]|uniref:C2 domain-containing protein n=1 Tax=Effrenium voratum TaxID=2562239 RepID=A0AA36NG92_9DINO|nr:unnamed protein product [Effrenium voratum]CAJ1444624.1 unnamed protein product [Effrenium voratum]
MAGGFPGGPGGPLGPAPLPPPSPALPGPALGSAELAKLRQELAEEERRIHAMRSGGHPGSQVAEDWIFRSPDGAPLNLRQEPSLEKPSTGQILQPGERFQVVEKLVVGEVTFLRLRDGRGWAFDGKPQPSSSLWGWFSSPEKQMLCMPVSAMQAPAPAGLTPASVLAPRAAVGPQPHQQVLQSQQWQSQHQLQSQQLPQQLPQQQLPQQQFPQQQLPQQPQSQPARLQMPYPSAPIPALLGQPASEPIKISKLDTRSPTVKGSPASSPASKSTGPMLHVRVHCARALKNTDYGGFFGNKSDPYVVVRFGKEEKKTPVIDNELNPVWTAGRDFTFQVEDPSAKIQLEVFNSNMFNDDTLGKTELLALEAVPTGRWLRRIDQLQSSSRVAPAEGELEYEVMRDGIGTALRGASLHSGVPSAGLPAPPPEDMQPGLYTVVKSTAVYSTSTNCTDRDIVGHIAAGQRISVEEVLNCVSEDRVRGLVKDPPGWVPLLDTRDGFHWAKPVVRKSYLVDNTWLNSSGGGLAYRFTKDLRDKDPRPGELGGAPWNSEVYGEDEGDGWLKVADGRFLPLEVDGLRVLKEPEGVSEVREEAETAAAEEELDRLYRELNRRMEGLR